jgi:hypothetical protein
MPRRALGFLTIAALLSACSGEALNSAQPETLAQQRVASSSDYAIPPRLQWMGNYGYCGEVSLISAGLYYGQYASQYTVRALASNNRPQNEATSQLLLGVNDTYAARRMHLASVEWNTRTERSTPEFLNWVARNVLLGLPVAIGVYTNEYRFYGKTNPNAGDPSYDHIVPVVGAANDTITFSDNGLWSPDPKTPPYLFHYSFASFPRSRRQANARTGPVYSLANDGKNYGIAITGVVDLDREMLPVRVATNVNYEKPAIKNGTSIRPKPMALELTVTVSGLEPGASYELYRYDRFAAVPDAHVNARAKNASEHWHFSITSGDTYVVQERIMSDEIAVYRAVRSSSP